MLEGIRFTNTILILFCEYYSEEEIEIEAALRDRGFNPDNLDAITSGIEQDNLIYIRGASMIQVKFHVYFLFLAYKWPEKSRNAKKIFHPLKKIP